MCISIYISHMILCNSLYKFYIKYYINFIVLYVYIDIIGINSLVYNCVVTLDSVMTSLFLVNKKRFSYIRRIYTIYILKDNDISYDLLHTKSYTDP